jgi:hypothetical protein
MAIFYLASDRGATSAKYKASAPILIVAYIVIVVVCMRWSWSSRESTNIYLLTVDFSDLANDIHAPWLFRKNVYEIIDVIFDVLDLDTVSRNPWLLQDILCSSGITGRTWGMCRCINQALSKVFIRIKKGVIVITQP